MAPVDDHDGAGHEARGRGREEEHGRDHLGGIAEPPERNPTPDDPLTGLGSEELLVHGRREVAGADRVDAHAVTRELQCHHPRELDQAGLADRAGDQVISFSRGMRQRVALERALIHEPRLALLDEPFTGLDDASSAALVRRLGMLKQSGTIVILATHDLDLAEGLLDEAVFLRDGRVAAAVSRPERLRATYRDVMGA